MNLTTEFNLCSRAAALGVPFVPEGWEFLGGRWVADHAETLPAGQFESVCVPHDPSCSWEREPHPIDAASWRDAASEWLEQFDIRVKRTCRWENCKLVEVGEWHISGATDHKWNLGTFPTRHAALVAAVTQVIEAKENER